MISIEIELQRQIDKLKKQLDEIAVRDRPGRISCVVYRSTAQTFTGAAALSWDAIKTDTTGGYMWAITDPTKLVAPVEGWYIVGSTFLFDSTQITAGDVLIQGYHRANGTDFLTGPCSGSFNAMNFRHSWSSEVYLEKGEYVEAFAAHGFGVNKSIGASTATNLTGNSGWIAKVG